MNYDQEINKIVLAVGEDKSIRQPWRNKVKARLEEAQAFIRYGQTVTSQKVDPAGATRFPTPRTDPAICSCPPAGIDPDCPFHGSQDGQ